TGRRLWQSSLHYSSMLRRLSRVVTVKDKSGRTWIAVRERIERWCLHNQPGGTLEISPKATLFQQMIKLACDLLYLRYGRRETGDLNVDALPIGRIRCHRT